MKPFFSVVIPLYNKEQYIEATLKSVLNQTFQDFEVIVVDDGSTDKSLEKALTFKDSRITITKQKNVGVSIARNEGIKIAKSKYIALIDADDFWYSNHLFELKKQILLFPNAGLYCNNYEIYYTKKIFRPANFNFNFDTKCLIVKDFFTASITNNVALTSAVGFSKEKFNSIGKFNTQLKTGQDLDLWIRFALKYNISFNPKITMSYKLYIGDSLSKNEFNNIRYNFTANFIKEEKSNKSLKKYLDINRYAVAIRCILNEEQELYKKLKKEIDYNNLNFKQKILLKFPKILLKIIKNFQKYLMKQNIYITAYK